MKKKLLKIYLKLLKASCKKKWDKARDLNAKIIEMELKLNESNKR